MSNRRLPLLLSSDWSLISLSLLAFTLLDDLQEGFGHKRALSDASFKGHSSQMVTNTQCQPLRRCHSGYAPQVGRLSPRSTGNLYQSKKLRRILSSCEEIPSGVIESGQTALGEEFKIVIASASPSSLSNSTIHNVWWWKGLGQKGVLWAKGLSICIFFHKKSWKSWVACPFPVVWI